MDKKKSLSSSSTYSERSQRHSQKHHKSSFSSSSSSSSSTFSAGRSRPTSQTSSWTSPEKERKSRTLGWLEERFRMKSKSRSSKTSRSSQETPHLVDSTTEQEEDSSDDYQVEIESLDSDEKVPSRSDSGSSTLSSTGEGEGAQVFVEEEGEEEGERILATEPKKHRGSVRKTNVQTRINSTVRKQLADLMARQNARVSAQEQLRRANTTGVRERKHHSSARPHSLTEGGEGLSERRESGTSSGTTGMRALAGSLSSSLTRMVSASTPKASSFDSELIDVQLDSEESYSRKGSLGSETSLASATAHSKRGPPASEQESKADTQQERSQELEQVKTEEKRSASRMTSFMMNVSKLLSAYQKKTQAQKDNKSLERQKKREQRQSIRLGDLIHYLPRGGVYVITSIGPVQFGMPPETVKDSMELGLRVPSVFVVPRERFNLSAGVNVCEIEFPAFFNFFVLMKSVTLVTHRDTYEDLVTIMSEALNGPSAEHLYTEKEYSSSAPESVRAACPDHPAEIFHFRAPNRKPGSKSKLLDVDMLLDIKFFDDNGMCDLGEGVFVFDDQENSRFELQDEKMQRRISTGFSTGNSATRTTRRPTVPTSSSSATSARRRSSFEEQRISRDNVDEQDDDEDDEGLEVKGIIVPYRDAESCTISPSAGLLPKFDLSNPDDSLETESRRSRKLSEPLSEKQFPPVPPVRPKRKSLVKIGERSSRRGSAMPGQNGGKDPPHTTSFPRASLSTEKVTAITVEAPPVPQRQLQTKPLSKRAARKLSHKMDSFQIPKFGLTVLGNSHGFDPAGSTSGFVLWVNGQGVMVDPPPHSTSLLLESGIPPNAITAIILTHCHADHDAGTFQKMITEGKVTLMTTLTVFESFKRKYAAVSGLRGEFIQQLVHFRPMFLEEPNYWNGATFRFFYSLHSIPCVGFQVSLEGKSIVYSGDTFYDPPALQRMHLEGTLSQARLDALLNFPWHCDIVLHEAGVPPIHTPIEALAELPKNCKKNIHLIHIDKRAALRAEMYGFRIAQAGIENTMVLIPRGEDHKTLKFLQLIGSMEIFRHFAVSQALDLMLMAKEAYYPRGSLILRKGAVSDKFMIMLQGKASVQFEEVKKHFRAGDYLGELAAWNQFRHLVAVSHSGEAEEGDVVKETVIAETDVKVMEIDKYALNYLLASDPILRAKIETMVHARVDGSWEAISANSRLRLLSSNQKTDLQALLSFKELRRGDVVWTRGDPVSIAVLISHGDLIFEEIHGMLDGTPAEDADEEGDDYEDSDDGRTSAGGAMHGHAPLSTGMLIFDYYGFHGNRPLTTTLVCKSRSASLFVLDSKSMAHFLDRNPRILLALLKSPILM